MIDVGLKSWLRRLAAGDVVVGHIRTFEAPVRTFFESIGVKSVMAVPVFADGHFWGQIGLEDCHDEREWSSSEIEALKTLAELIGAAVTRTQQLTLLADANRIVESSPTILYRLSPNKPFDLIYLSQNIRRYGYTADELLAAPDAWLLLFEDEYHSGILADLNSIVEGRAENTLREFRLKTADGSHAWLEGRAYAVRNEEYQLLAVEGILTDVTERKQAESEISFSHVLLTTAIENSPQLNPGCRRERSNHHVQPEFPQTVGYSIARRKGRDRFASTKNCGVTDEE